MSPCTKSSMWTKRVFLYASLPIKSVFIFVYQSIHLPTDTCHHTLRYVYIIVTKFLNKYQHFLTITLLASYFNELTQYSLPFICVSSMSVNIFFYPLLGETTKALSVTWMSTPLFVYFPSIYINLLLYYIITYNITYHIELQIKPN